MERAGRQQDRAGSFFGFRLAHFERTARDRVNGTTYFQRSAFLVEVAPLEPTNLAAAQAGGDLRVEEIVPQRLGADRLHESVELFFVQNVHGLTVEFRDHCSLGGIVYDKPGPHRRLHDLVEQHVNSAHGGF